MFMSALLIATLSILLIAASCQHYLTVEDLPEDVKQDLENILQGTLISTTNCSSPQSSDIQFLLYTQSNIDNPIILNASNPTELDSNKKIILLMHGWISGPTYIGIPELKDEYVKKYDCNLIIVDWSKIAWQSYRTSRCQLSATAQIVANFLCLLQQNLNIGIDRLHIIGHSMGGQLAGFTGQHTIATCGEKVGRITGLDPAGFLFQGYPVSDRLDASDASFVDVIYTNALMFGYWGNCGHANFHVNCGIIQPGCPDFNISNVENVLVATVICSHVRSLYYMAESVSSNEFKGKSCRNCPLICAADSKESDSCVLMGENSPINTTESSYWVPTKHSSPYAAGCLASSKEHELNYS